MTGFTLERGATVRDLILENQRTVGVKADTPGGSREFRADLVIGADGRASVVRKRAQLREDRILQGFDVVWWHLPFGVLDSGSARGYVGGGRLFILYPSPEGHLQFGWTIAKGTFTNFRELGAQGWYGAVAPHVSDDLRGFLDANRAALAHPVLLDVVCDRLIKWTAPGVLAIGDAAHPMSPVGGQGLNIALRDALVAANHLAPVLARDDSSAEEIDLAARQVQAERWSEVVRIQDLQQTGPAIILFGGLLSRVLLSAPVVAFAKRFLSAPISRRFDPFLYGSSKVTLRE